MADNPLDNEPDPPVWTFNSDDIELGTTDFDSFDIERDYSQLNERIYTDPSKKMYVENSEFKDSINITYNGNKATVSCGKLSGATAQTDGAHVIIKTTKDVACNIKGNSENGSLKIVGENKVRINLRGVNLKNPNGPSVLRRNRIQLGAERRQHLCRGCRRRKDERLSLQQGLAVNQRQSTAQDILQWCRRHQLRENHLCAPWHQHRHRVQHRQRHQG